MIEPHPGVFVGHVSALVRDRLWDKVCAQIKEGGAIQAWSTNNEQRFMIRMAGNTDRRVIDLEGLYFVQRKPRQSRDK